MRRHLLAICVGAVILVFGVGTLGATTEIAGAVVASGSLVVASNIKKVQHQTGGVVSDLFVEEGSRVKAGQVLVRLDETVARATLGALTHDYYGMMAQRDRLEAEGNGAATVTFGAELTGSDDPEARRGMEAEARLFQLRSRAREGQKGQLRQRIAQLHDEIDGLKQQLASKDGELTIVSRELVGVKNLFDRNLVQLTRLDALERDQTRIAGERGALIAQIAQTKGKVSEIDMQIIQIDADMRSEVARQISELRSKVATTLERQAVAADQLAHLDIRAPQDGIVHELAVHAKGAVVMPGETVMTIVPDADRLVVEVHVAPQDIDQVAPGQAAMLRFPSLNQRTTPEIMGRVSRIGADTSQDVRAGQPYFVVQVSLTGDGVSRTRLRPGMPAETFITTGERTMMSYLIKPLADQMRRAFREK